MSDSLLFINGRFYTDGHESHFAKCMLVVNGFITYIGDDIQHARALAADNNAIVHDLEEKYVLPGFIDGHAHTLLLGQKLQKLELEHCKNVEDVRSAIRAYAQTHSDLARIMCSGWMEHMTEGNVTTGMLDDLDPRPIFIDSRDLHSSWCNTPAMEEMEVYSLPDPVGGKIHRDADGVPTGLFSEAACVFLVWPHLAKVASPRDRIEAVRRAIHDMNASGLTGLIDMAMDEISWDALQQLRREEGGQLPVHVAAHWFIKPTDSTPDDLAQVDKAIELQRQFNQETSPELWITGIKLMCDGVIDSCTAALLEPYTTGHDSAPVIWSHDALGAVVQKADNAGLQCALHAIGDGAVKLAIDSLSEFGTPGHRHRIEHLELTSPGDGARLAAAGITASVQPAHADPSLLKEWPKLLGKGRCKRAFAYREFLDAGANVAIGSDTPTAPHRTLQNLYVATTRRSLREPENSQTVNPEFALSLSKAVSSATYGSAYSCFAESWTGSLAVPKRANFVVANMEWDPLSLVRAQDDSDPSASTLMDLPLRYKSVSSEEPLRTSQEATGEKSQSKAEEDEAGAAEGMGRSSSAVVAKQRALSEMHARLGGNIEDILVERIQPKEKVAEGEWRCKAPMRWRKGLLRALAKLVRLEVTTQEISDLLCARVDARQRQEKRSGPGNSAVRQTEVYEVMDRLKAMGRGMERVVAEDHDMEDIGEDSDEGDIVD
ncbi:hypothetical protein D0861_07110 [Hortaea werneckii]|uniref:Amidohydrolase 3 domain-containing protein n=1 Tax=Hortaea werneckii TaxID=91943 RepID=A0A3M7F5T6_HORWE|nr:hypothetical protein D0861_07110 [Hortaea werneckii]